MHRVPIGRSFASNTRPNPRLLASDLEGACLFHFHGLLTPAAQRHPRKIGSETQGSRQTEKLMASIVRGVVKAIREKGLSNFLRELKEEGYTKCFFDGNLLQTKIHNIGARLVGVDKFGNKYFENLDVQYGRHRWVEYGSKGRYNASQVPAEWHGWLHYITDHTGDELLMLKPSRYGVEHRQNFSGEGDEYIYHSKGHALNPGQRDWTRYQSWQPTKR